MQYYNKFAAIGTYVARFNAHRYLDKHGMVKINNFSIEVDNAVNISDNVGLLAMDGSQVPLPLSGSMDETTIGFKSGIPDVEFKIVTSVVNTQIWIRLDFERPRDEDE